MDISKELMQAAKTSRARHKVYSASKRDSLTLHADLLALLFPNILTQRGSTPFYKINPERAAMIHFITAKLARYAISLDNGDAHLDSLHDLGIYAIMLERIEKEAK